MTDPTIHIPDALPLLSKGNHQPGTGKACIMDAVSIISGRPNEQDQPSCVHPLLRYLFVQLNDTADDEQRHRLWAPALRAMGTASPLDEPMPGSDRQRLVVALLVGQIRRALTGQRVADHPAAPVLEPLLAWQQRPTWETRRALIGRQRPAHPGCRGCTLLNQAGQLVVELPVMLNLSWAFADLCTWDGQLAALEAILDDWLTILPSRPVDAPTEVPWGALRDELGVVVPADDARRAAAMTPAAPTPEWSDG